MLLERRHGPLQLDDAQAIALERAAESARPFLLSRRAFKNRVTHVLSARLQYARVLHEIEHGLGARAPSPDSSPDDGRLSKQVRLEPEAAVRVMHPNADDPVDFDVSASSGDPLEDAQVAQTELPDTLRASIDPERERVHSSRLQRFESRVHRIAYKTAFGRGVLVIGGRTPVLLSTSDFKPLRRRRRVLVLGLLLMLAAVSYSWQRLW